MRGVGSHSPVTWTSGCEGVTSSSPPCAVLPSWAGGTQVGEAAAEQLRRWFGVPMGSRCLGAGQRAEQHWGCRRCLCSQHRRGQGHPTRGGGGPPSQLPGRASLQPWFLPPGAAQGSQADPSGQPHPRGRAAGRESGLHCQEAQRELGCFQVGLWSWTLFGGPRWSPRGWRPLSARVLAPAAPTPPAAPHCSGPFLGPPTKWPCLFLVPAKAHWGPSPGTGSSPPVWAAQGAPCHGLPQAV